MKNLSNLPTSVEVNSSLTESPSKQSSYSQVFIKTKISQDIKQIAASMAVATIARRATVQIITSSEASGSGVIINKQGYCYTVLAANHLVENAEVECIIYTHEGKNYPATYVNRLQSSSLAIFQFSTSEEYSVATLNHTNEDLIGTSIYVSGYLQNRDSEPSEFKFLNGMIINCVPEKFLHNSTVVYSGMSGAPVFNTKGEVIGIYLTRIVAQDREVGVKTNVFIPL